MLEGLRSKEYLRTSVKRFDPLALIASVVGLGAVLLAVGRFESPLDFLDFRSFLIVVVGTAVCILFQYDFQVLLNSVAVTLNSFVSTPDRHTCKILEQLDEAILQNEQLVSLREGQVLDGELLNDIVYMYNRGLLLEEIDEFVASRVSEQLLRRQIAATMLRRAAYVSPALGLFGTVVGLIGVLRAMDTPAEIGPSMSLALMTTAYGVGFGSLLFTPLAGRIEHHNIIFVETHRRLMSKVAVLLTREERQMERVHAPVPDI